MQPPKAVGHRSIVCIYIVLACVFVCLFVYSPTILIYSATNLGSRCTFSLISDVFSGSGWTPCSHTRISCLVTISDTGQQYTVVGDIAIANITGARNPRNVR